jgi:hypothetical protein
MAGKLVLSGTVGWIIYILLIINFVVQLYMNYQIYQLDNPDKKITYINYYNIGFNVLILMALLYLGMQAISV